MMTFEGSDALCPDEALEPNCSCAHAIVSAANPYSFVSVDPAFAACFSEESMQTLETRGMAALHRGSTDALRWATVLQSARDGRIGTTAVTLRAPGGGERRTLVTCTPVAAAANGPIAQILVHLAPAADTPALSPSALAAKIPRERGRAPRPRPSVLRGGQDGGLARGRGRRHTGSLDESG